MGFVEQLKRRGDEVKQLLEYAFPYSYEDSTGKTIIDETDGVITVSDYSADSMHNYYKLEILDALLIQPFVKDEKRLEIFKNLKKKLYLIPISKDRQGRREIFDTVKAKYQRDLEDREKGIEELR